MKRPQDSQLSDFIVYLSWCIRPDRKYPSILEFKTERRQALVFIITKEIERAGCWLSSRPIIVDWILCSRCIDQSVRFRPTAVSGVNVTYVSYRRIDNTVFFPFFPFCRQSTSCRELVSGSFSIKLKRRNLMNGLYDFTLAFAYKVSVSILFVEVCEVLHANGMKFKFVNFDF